MANMAEHGTAGAGRGYEDTLVPLLVADRVDFDSLHERYHSLLELVRTLIGVVPNCDPYLEIWPPAFRTYNLMVPNLLNLPASLLGVGPAPAGVVGLGMYAASRAAECPYCSAHTCSFALRRGARPSSVAAAVGQDHLTDLTAGEASAVAVAEALARVPSRLTVPERDELERHFGPDGAEWIVWGVVMMGFLNKFMDAVGVELEASTVAEVSSTMGPGWNPGVAGWDLGDTRPGTPPPADSLRTKAKVAPLVPGALRLDRQWQRGVPTRWPAIGRYLTERTGHAFDVLAAARHHRPVRAVASMLRENLDPTTTRVGLATKVELGAVFAAVVGDDGLAADVAALAAHHGVAESRLQAVTVWAVGPDTPPPADGDEGAALLLLARAASTTPAAVDRSVVAACRDADLGAAAVVEVVCWLSVLQLLHRLHAWVAPA